MIFIVSNTVQSSVRGAKSAFGRKVVRKIARTAIAEAIESRLLMSAAYALTPLASFASNMGTPNGVVMYGGNLYGTTQSGGANNLGSIYELAAGSSTITSIADFSSGTGGDPVGTLIVDSQGDLYGVTSTGGPSSNSGTVFELPAGSSTITVLASLDSNSGVQPGGGLTIDSQGDLFGFTQSGGTNNLGAVYELVSGNSSLTPLASFDSSAYQAAGAPVIDSAGNLFGNSSSGGDNGDGAVFELASGGNSITTLASLDWNNTGAEPLGGLAMDSNGNLYGTTQYGGGGNYGVVFEVDGTTHAITALALGSLSQSSGANIRGTPLLDSQGNLFGTTVYNGDNNEGAIFEIPSGANSSVELAPFTSDTGRPASRPPWDPQVDTNLVMDSNGNLFGATSSGGLNGNGAIFELPPVATQVVVTQQPTDITADATDSVTVKMEDSLGNVDTSINSNVTISVATGPNGGSIIGTATVAAVNGVATFTGLSFHVSGPYTLSINEGSLPTATTNSFNVTFGAASKLAFAQQPTNTVAGGTIAPIVVDVEDAFGNLVSTDSSMVTLTNSPGIAAVTLAAQNGVATFSGLILTATNTYSCVATDSSLTQVTSNNYAITPAAPFQLAFAQQPTGTTAGSTLSPVIVDVEDIYGNAMTGNTSNVTLTASPGSATATIAAINGVATFSNLSFTAPNSYSYTASDSSLTTATSNSFTITSGASTVLVITQQPTGITANATDSLVVKFEDAFGNVDTGNNSNVTIAIATGPNGGSLGGTATVAASSGVATFSGLSFHKAGPYALVISGGGLPVATTNSFNVSAGAASHLAFAQQPTDSAAGNMLSPVIVDVEDAYGNVVAADSSNVTLTAFPGNGTSSIIAQSGAASFSALSFTQVGTYSYTATDGGLTSATSSNFTITPGAASQLVITQQPDANTIGHAVSPIVVVVEDAYGNLVANNSSTLNVTLSGTGSAVLAGTTSIAATNGSASFNDLSISSGGAYTLSFAASGVTPAQSTAITTPPDVSAGTALDTVAVDLASTNQSYSPHEVLTATLVSGPTGAKLWGTTKVKAKNGQASFKNLVFKQAGSYTIDISDANGSVMQQTVTVAPSAATHLQFAQQPAIVNGEISTSVEIVDRYGNVVTTDTSAITLRAGPYATLRGGTLAGTVTESAVNGIATFSNLTVTSPGLYRLIARAANKGLVASSVFRV